MRKRENHAPAQSGEAFCPRNGQYFHALELVWTQAAGPDPASRSPKSEANIIREKRGRTEVAQVGVPNLRELRRFWDKRFRKIYKTLRLRSWERAPAEPPADIKDP